MYRFYTYGLMLLAVLLAATFTSCNDEPSQREGTTVTSVRGEINSLIQSFDTTFVVPIDGHKINNGLSIDAASQKVEIHFDLMSIYVFSDGDFAGDYYLVTGYVVTHNKDLNTRYISNKDYVDYPDAVTQYLGKLALNTELLDKDGKQAGAGDAFFRAQPNPETTIGSTSYTKGFDFTLNFAITAGITRDNKKNEYKLTFLPIYPSFNWNNSSKQELPDIVVKLDTDPVTREVKHVFSTCNYETMEPTDLPVFTKGDLRVDFSWIWFVPKGHMSARDYCNDGMKLRFKFDPHYFVNYTTTASTNSAVHTVYTYGYDVGNQLTDADRTMTVDFPMLKRTPVGTLLFKNTTRNYVSNVRFSTIGAMGNEVSEALDGVALDQNDELSHLLPEGKYDIHYSIVNGDTGASLGNFVVKNVEITGNNEVSLSTLNGQRE